MLLLHQVVNGPLTIGHFKGLLNLGQGKKKLRPNSLSTVCAMTSIKRDIYSKSHLVLGLDYTDNTSRCRRAIEYFKGLSDLSQKKKEKKRKEKINAF